MRRNLRSTDSYILVFLYCRDKHLELLLATIRLLEDKVKKKSHKMICLFVFSFGIYLDIYFRGNKLLVRGRGAWSLQYWMVLEDR